MEIWIAPLSLLAIFCIVAWCQTLFPNKAELTEELIKDHIGKTFKGVSVKWLLIDRTGRSAMVGTEETGEFILIKLMGIRITALSVPSDQLTQFLDQNRSSLQVKTGDITFPQITYQLDNEADLLEFKSWLDQQGVRNA